MEPSVAIERDCPFSALFQQIINEMKNSTPLWEDFTAKSTKLHSCLRATIQAITSFLDALQKIADAATSTKGATKDIGTALTRICLRHKSLETKMKTFASSLMDCLILPLQEKLEDWKKTTVQLDKEHAKEYKRSRSELKKRSIETIRLQKKLRKGHNGGLTGSFTGTLPRNHHGSGTSLGSNGSDSISLHGGNRDLNRILEVALRDTAEKRQAFEDSEKQAIRNALTEERSRFCLFVSYLKPVVDQEVAMLYELTHVQEAMQQLEKHSTDPFALPPSSEQARSRLIRTLCNMLTSSTIVIADLKGSCDSGAWSFTTPPSSPSSLGSRKSSMCSISSVNSSSSGSAHSPSHKAHHRTVHHPPVMAGHPVGTLRYSSVSSQDSGFTSQDTLYSRLPTPFYDHQKTGNQSEGSNTSSTASSNSSTPSSPYPPAPVQMSTWPNIEDSKQFERAACAIMNDRPHTISSAYERGHQRTPLTVYTFQPPNENNPTSPSSTPVVTPVVEPQSQNSQAMCVLGGIYQSASEIYGILRGNRSDAKPPVPKRCSSLERPQSFSGGSGCATPKPLPKNNKSKDGKNKQPDGNMSNKYASNVPDFNQSADDMIVPQPVYVNMHELNQMASAKMQRQAEMDLPPPPPELMGPANKVETGMERNGKFEGSLASSGYGSQNQIGAYGEDTHTSQNISSIYGTGIEASCPPGRQPTLGSGSSGTSSRRNSCGIRETQDKPPPPIRRNSSISASPSRNSPVPMSPVPSHHQNNTSSSSMTNSSHYHPSPLAQNNVSTASHNSHSYPIYIQNPTYSQNGSVNNINGNISSHGSLDSGETTPHASMENLPPPPAYLIGPSNSEHKFIPGHNPEEVGGKRVSVAETIKSLTEKNHHPASPNSVRRSQSMKQPEEEMKEKEIYRSSSSNQGNKRGSANNTESIISNKSRTNLMQVLNQKLAQHQASHSGNSSPVPGQQQQHTSTISHNNYQQNHSQSQPIYQQLTSHPPPQQQYSQSQPIYSQVYQSVQQPQPIYQQIIPSNHPTGVDQSSVSRNGSNNVNSSPLNPRRFSEELLKTTATFVQNRVLGNKTPTPVVTSKEIFVQTLNAKLSQMRQIPPPPNERKNSYPFSHPQNPHMQQQSPNKPTSFASKLVASVSVHQKGNSVGESRAFRVRQWISSKTVSDPTICRESLMDQIRKGTKLKPARVVNDRSAPKINH